MMKIKPKTKEDAYKSILVISILAVLGVVSYIAITLAGYVGYPLGEVSIFLGSVGAVLAIGGGGMILYPTTRTTGVGVALVVLGGFLLIQTMFTLM